MALQRILDFDTNEKERLGFVHTPGEIAQQPEVWQETAAGLARVASELKRMLETEEIVLTGAGSSYFIGRCAESALEARLPEQRVRTVASTEIVMDPENTLPRRPFTLVSVARSGNSPEGNAAFRLAEALRPGLVKHIVLTCNPDGELAKLAAASRQPAALYVLPAATNDGGLAMTSSFTSLVVALQGLGFLDTIDTYQHFAAKLAQSFRGVVATADDLLESLAEQSVNRAFFIGARPFYGGALESHLKVQEMTDGQVLAKAEDTLGLRHGPMAGIDASTLVVLFGSSSSYRQRYETDLLREMAAKNLGMTRMVVCTRPVDSWAQEVHHVIATDPRGDLEIPDDLLSPVLVVPAQLFGMYKSINLGLRPDVPSRSNVINRVVEGVTIYPYEPQEGVR